MLVPKPPKHRKTTRPVTFAAKPVTMMQLRRDVFMRDGGCLGLKAYPLSHVCDGPLTLEHVLGVHSPEDPRQHNERHTVTLCHGLNGISIASRDLREHLRAYLRDKYPDC